METFKDANLPPALAEALLRMGFEKPTPVQAASIPPALEGRDILGTAQTGTGKTGAFSIPMAAQLYSDSAKQGLILAPTRELAAQIHTVLRQMTKKLGLHGSLVVGGESFSRQVNEMRDRCDYIVATPGRLCDHLEERTTDLSFVKFMVLDEADRMLDMGFAPQLRRIMQDLPKERQTLLFSATLAPEIKSLANQMLNNPVRVEIGSLSEPISKVKEEVIRTTSSERNTLIFEELDKREGRVLVFARTQRGTDRLARLLYGKGHPVVCLHGGRNQGQRKRALDSFRSGSSRIMVATDIAGRGIDVPDIEHVINFDLPASREDYIHRIGRTGRFGREGRALSFLLQGDREGERLLGMGGGSRPAGGGGRPHGGRPGGRPFGGRSQGRPQRQGYARR